MENELKKLLLDVRIEQFDNDLLWGAKDWDQAFALDALRLAASLHQFPRSRRSLPGRWPTCSRRPCKVRGSATRPRSARTARDRLRQLMEQFPCGNQMITPIS